MDDSPGPVDRDRLNGWKEISAFLGKGVRTVQRWEREYGLPVHRLGRAGGEIIWASRQELDDWSRTRGAMATANDEPISREDPPLARRSFGWGRLAIILVVLVVVAAASLFFRSAPGQPDTWDFDSGRLTVFDHRGRQLFSKPLGIPGAESYDPRMESRSGGRVVLTDLDHDGSVEIIFGGFAPAFPAEVGLFVFDARGRERFVYRPSHRVAYGADSYSGPWAPRHIWIVEDGGDPSIFVAFISGRDFACLLTQLDARGVVKAEYWSDGYIESLVHTAWRGRPALFVGGTNNDTRGGSLAIFEGGVARGSAPARNPNFRCASGCPPGGPTDFLVFPRRAAAEHMPGTNQATVQELRIGRDGSITANVAEGAMMPEGVFRSVVWYTLDSDLTPIVATLTAGLFAEHEAWQARGVLPPWSKADEDQLARILEWDAATQDFATLRVPRIVR